MSKQAVIVGGGVVGASTALFLAREGWGVTLIEKGRLGGRASRAALGILSPPFFLDPAEPDEDQNTQPLLSRKGYDFYPDFLDLLGEYNDRDVEYEQSGMWYLTFTEEEYDEKQTIHREMKKFNRSAEWAEAGEVRQELPFVSPEVKGGLFFTEEAQVNPDRLMDALLDALEREDVTVLEGTPVRELRHDGTVPSVVTADEEYRTDAVLIAAGAWSRELGEDLNVTVPVHPRKGEMLSVDAPGLAGEPPVRRGDRFVVPRHGKAILGSTTEDAGFDVTSTAGAMQDLLASGIELVPHLAEASFVDAWAGLRPYAERKGGPFLGTLPGHDTVYLACGHYKTGILQGPYTGMVMSQFIRGETPDLDVSRYGINRS